MGKYQVSECIGRGGMAEVFLARQEGIGGFEKLVALKRIYPHLVHDDTFVEMFLNEARIAASLQHPKIVQIFGIESDADGLFIVMEYLAGEPLSTIARILFDPEETQRLPVAIACRIASDVATGLHAAHTARDAEGHERPVVHRDVTPSNILVTYSGEVKVVDFGVAKAIKRKGTTDKNVLKGKTPYLSPEQIGGNSVDARADVFQLGIVLHEMLTGQQLFDGDSLQGILQAITDQEICAPSVRNPEVPASLDVIVLRALQRDPADRFQNADDMAQALDAVAAELGDPVSERALGKWMRKTFPDRLKDAQRRKKNALGREQSPDIDTDRFRSDADHLPTQMATSLERPPRTAKTNRGRAAAIVGTVFVALVLGILWIARADEQEPREVSTPQNRGASGSTDAQPAAPTIDAGQPGYRLSITVVPATANIELDGTAVAVGEYSAILRTPSSEVRLSAPGFVPQRFTISRAHPAPNVVRLQPMESGEDATTPSKKYNQKPDPVPESKTKPFGSDNLNPWESD